jgi:hypothetical protein
MHRSPGAQALSHEPQWLGLPKRLTQSPLQSVRPCPHPARHTPAWQTWFAAQAVSHAPQWS